MQARARSYARTRTDSFERLQERWDAVDRFIESRLVEQDDALRAAAGGIAVSPALGKFLHLLALAANATRILELGTLRGYSAIWLARALPAGGELVFIDADKRAAGARRFYAAVAAEPSVQGTALQTVGVKGHDGFVLARKAG